MKTVLMQILFFHIEASFLSLSCKANASLVVWGNSLSVISGKRKIIRSVRSRKGDPRITIGSPDQILPRSDMNGMTRPKMRAMVEVTPVA